MSDISTSVSFSFTDGGQSGGIESGTLSYDFGVTPLFEDSLKVMSTNYSDITLSVVGWTNTTFGMFINRSATDGEDITLGRHSQFTAGGTDDGTFSGGSLAATQTGAGYYKECTAAGTSQSKTWEVGDIAVYLGGSGLYLQLRPAPFAKLKPGEAALIRVPGDGKSWKAKAATGTPYLGYNVVGTLDE